MRVHDILGLSSRKSERLFLLLIAIFAGLFAVSSLEAVEVEYAKGFSVTEREGYRVVEVSRLWEGSGRTSRYLLVPRESELSELGLAEGEENIIRTPVKDIVALSTTYLYPLVRLDELEALVGVDKLEYIYNRKVRNRGGDVCSSDLLRAPSVDLERIISLSPELVMATGVAGEWNTAKRLEDAGVPVVVNGDYLEQSPLGRAEWIKFIGLFFEKEELASDIFAETEERYLELCSRVEESESKPSVFLNRPMQGRWVLPGGDSYMARFLEDAGSRYVLSSSEERAALILDVEKVYRMNLETEYWLHQYGWTRLRDIPQHDPRLAKLRAVREEKVINNNARVRRGGGNDFYESGPYRPDLILEDLLTIFHPELTENTQLYYYRYLR